MKIFKIENNYNYTAKCPNCPSLLKFNIDENKLIINGKCKNDHYYEDIDPSLMIDILKNTYYYKNYCYKCQMIINENLQNLICINCNKLYCNNCINSHSEEKNHKTIIFNKNFRFCKIHNIDNKYFCDDCNINICDECKSLHNSHSIMNFSSVMKNATKKKMNNSEIDDFQKKIKNLLSYIIIKKEEIEQRFNKLKDFLNCLLYINEKLLKKFNYSVFDYYNFHNFELFYEYQNKESSLEIEKNMNYLFFGPILEKKNANELLIKKIIREKDKIITNKGIDNFNICDYQNLRYLKDNIFFLYEQNEEKNSIKFYIYKNFSFKLHFHKLLKNIDKMNYIKIGYFNNIFIITRGKKSKIYSIKYNIEEKSVEMNKVYDPYKSITIKEIIDIKNENYLVSDNKSLIVINNNNNLNIDLKHYSGNCASLNNIDSSLFLVEDYFSCFHFFNSNNCKEIKSIVFPQGFKFVIVLKSEFIVFTKKFLEFYFVNIKYLEIVQKLNHLRVNKEIAISNSGLYEFIFGERDVKIKKFNFEDGCFYNLTSIKNIYNKINHKNIKFIDDNFVFACTEDELKIFNY